MRGVIGLVALVTLAGGFRPAQHGDRIGARDDSKCRVNCGPLLEVLRGGPNASQVGAGGLQSRYGATVTDTRASSKTCCTNASCSTVVTLSNNQPCVDTVGLNVEGSATNLMLSSGAVGSGVGGTNTPWAWGGTGGASSSLNQAVAPDGTTTASTITLSGASAGSKLIYQNYTVTASTTYTCAVWLWTSSGTYQLRLGRTNQASWATATVGPTLTLNTTPTRYSLTYTSAVGETGSAFTIGSENKTPFLAADGSFFAWGAQCELGSFATSYIPTTGTTATRAADVVDYQTALALGTTPSFGADVTLAAVTGTAVQFIAEPWNSGTDRWDIYVKTDGTLRCEYYNGTAFDGDSTATLTAGVKAHVSCGYDGTNVKACVGGACTSTAKTFTSSASYTKTGIGTDENSQGNNVLWGDLANLCISAKPNGCQ